MVHIDMTQPDRVLVPGVDLWEIKEAVDEKSAKGDPMIQIKLFRVSNPSDHLYDVIMLAGPGWPIGKKKLGALVEANFNGKLDLLDLLHRRLWVATEVQEYKGQPRLRVQIASTLLKHAGLQRAEDVPAGCALPEPPAEDPTPF